jgi:hypothetical protein
VWTDRHEAELAVRFTLGQPVTAAIPPGEESLFRLARDLASDSRALASVELTGLQALAGTLAPIFQRA